MGTPPLPTAAHSNAHPLHEELFPNVQSGPPLVQLEPVSSCPITCHLRRVRLSKKSGLIASSWSISAKALAVQCCLQLCLGNCSDFS